MDGSAAGSGAGPPEFTLCFRDWLIIDTGETAGHVAGFIELPVLVAMAAPPLAVSVMPFIFEAHRDAVPRESPQRFPEPVVLLPLPFALQELHHFGPPMEKHIAIPPLGILRVSQRHPFRIPAVRSVLGRLDLFEGGFFSKGRKGVGVDSWRESCIFLAKNRASLPAFLRFLNGTAATGGGSVTRSTAGRK